MSNAIQHSLNETLDSRAEDRYLERSFSEIDLEGYKNLQFEIKCRVDV